MGSVSIVFGALVLCAPLLALGGTPHSGCEGTECAADVGSLMQRTRTKTASDKSVAEITSTSKDEDENEDEDEVNGEDEGEDEDEDEDVNKRDLLTPRSPKTSSGQPPPGVTCKTKAMGGTGKQCHTSCMTNQNCYGYTIYQSGLLTGGGGCDHVIGSYYGYPCPAERCNLAHNRSCYSSFGLDRSLLSGESCTPSCVNGYSLSVNSEVPEILTCLGRVAPGTWSPHVAPSSSKTTGTWSPVPAYDCLPSAVTGSLTVKVLNAKDLADEDWSAGQSDAYVMLHLKHAYRRDNECTSSKQSNCRTATIENNNNPVWDEEFQFAISSREDKLALDVYDEDDAARDDRLGEKSGMDLREVIEQGGTKAYKLDLDPYKGTLNVELTFTKSSFD